MKNLTINIILDPESTKSDIKTFILNIMDEINNRGYGITSVMVDDAKVYDAEDTGFTEEFLE